MCLDLCQCILFQEVLNSAFTVFIYLNKFGAHLQILFTDDDKLEPELLELT